MRLILAARWAGRQLCRVGLHKWGRVREITGMKIKDTAPHPDGGIDVRFWATGNRYVIRCRRPGCKVEQSTRWRERGGHNVDETREPSTSTRPPDPPPTR